ncbi:MAG: TetR/AcrR family transcriptional regulator [Cellulomonadaceae bacterium]
MTAPPRARVAAAPAHDDAPAPTGARSPRASTARKRREILKAATEVFGNKGYSNGTLADIAEQVGMTHAGVLHHFGSKERLLLEVLDWRDNADVEGVEGGALPIGAQTFEHLIRTAVANSQRAGIVQVFTVLSAESVTDEHPAKDYFQDRYVFLRDALHRAFAQAYGEPTAERAEAIDAACASILAVMDGLQLQWLLAPESIDLGATTEFAIRALVAAATA